MALDSLLQGESAVCQAQKMLSPVEIVSMTVTYFGKHELTSKLFYQQLVDSPPAAIGVDLETISLKNRTPIGLGIATSPHDAWYFRLYPDDAVDARELELIIPLLNNPRIAKVFHNAMFDLRCFPLIDQIPSIDRSNIFDTNVAARILGREFTKLSNLSWEVGVSAVGADEMLRSGQTMLDLDPMEVAQKCANDAKITLALYYHFKDSIDSNYFGVEMQAIPILIDMSLRGLRVNQADRMELETKLTAEVNFYKRMCEEYKFNPASNQQVGYILASRGNFLPLTRSRRSLSVSEEQLDLLDDPIAAAVVNFRKANKFLSTYVKPLRDEDRIYTEYNLDAVVGRISSSKRNLQNIPESARHIFEPDTGIFTSGDFSQEHLRILAHFSGDRLMKRVYEEGEMDGDIHNFSAQELFGSVSPAYRRLAKVINYAIPYGATADTVSAQAKIRDIRKCAAFLDKWFKLFRDAHEWIIEAKRVALRDGWALPTLYGRRIRIPEESRDAMERKGVNYPILGSDGEIMKRALILCKDLPLAVTVHDSITCDGDIEFPVEQLENLSPVKIPFEVKQTLRWE